MPTTPPKPVSLRNLDAVQYDNLVRSFENRAIAAEAALSLEKALHPVRMDAFRDKVWDIVVEILGYSNYDPSGEIVQKYVDKIIEAY